MRAKAIDLAIDGVTVGRARVYHSCPSFRCGSVIGPSVAAHWWAEYVGTWVYMWDTDNLGASAPLAAAIDAALDPSPADLARRAQDERYESPDA